jgi:hypothetical protein
MKRSVFLFVVLCAVASFVGVICHEGRRGAQGFSSVAEDGPAEGDDSSSVVPEQEETKGTKNVSSSVRPHPPPAPLSTPHPPPSTVYALPSTVHINRDATFGTPRFVGKRSGFLSPPAPGVEPEEVLRAFVEANGRAFTLHASDVLDPANGTKTRDVVTQHSGMRSVTWRQQHEGLEIFGAHLALNLTKDNRIINVQSRALHVPSLRFSDVVTVTAEEAGGIAEERGRTANGREWTRMGNSGQDLQDESFQLSAFPISAFPIWYPVDMITVVKAWDVVVEQEETKGTKETHRLIIRADTGEVVEDINLTWGLEPVTFQVYTNDSPSAFSPGMNEPTNYVPPVVTQAVFSISALDTNASPEGWIPAGANTSLGNNVDAYADFLDDDQVDPGDRVDAAPLYRDFTGLNGSTSAVMQAFYWGNVFHDRLYQLGFDEVAGNFQEDNFSRGGRDADRMRIEVWNGAYQTPYGQFAQANMTVLNDGNRPRLQLYLWNRAADEFYNPHSPGVRDGALDAEVILHEAAHGVSARLIGDGYGLSTVQSRGMAEGWSDYMAMSLLSDPDDDPHGVYAFGAYVAAWQSWSNNYYFGIRRFPYTTDMNKAPQTFADSDPNQIHFDPAIPINPKWARFDEADQIHRVGEVWCLTLWECRANLIDRYGVVGNEMLLQLVVDGMKLTPENPDFLEARDAIFQADLVANGGTNQVALWQGFAKRGLGWSATVPEAHSTVGIQEAFDLPFGVEVEVTEVGGDGDGYVEPGESGELAVVLTSHEMELWTVEGELWSVGSGAVTVTSRNSLFGSVSAGGGSTSVPPFSISVDGAFPGNSNAWFTLRVESDKGWFEESFSVRIGNPWDYPPEILDVGVTNVTETNAWVTWRTGIPADGQVEYGSTTNYGLTTPLDRIMRTDQIVELTNLAKGTAYHYRIRAEGTNGLVAVSDDYSFRTRARIYVDANSTATQEVGSIEAPFKSLQAAADAAKATGDEILVAEGTYTGTDSEGVLVLVGSDWNLMIRGGYSNDFLVCDPDVYVTVIDGELQRRGVRLDGGAALSIGGFTVTRGNSEWGGGISVKQSSLLEAKGCIVVGNASTNGGNDVGGGVYATLGSEVLLSDCQIVSNAARWGGGIFCISSETSVQMNRCTVLRNSAQSFGGGVTVLQGGGIDAEQTVFSANEVLEGSGGAVRFGPFGTVSLDSCTISGNCVIDVVLPDVDGGGGIFIGGTSIGDSVLTIDNSIVFGNHAGLGSDLRVGDYSESYAFIHVSHSCIGDIHGYLTSSNNVVRRDPMFADPASGDFHLLYGSPCIDTGDPEYSSTTLDLDGEPRPFGARIDMGADEFVDADGDSMADYWEEREYGSVLTTEGTEDTDGDLLGTFGEYMAQTDPHDGDTDGDSMPDGWEITNGLNAKEDDSALDSDHDTMKNSAEYMADTDPQDADSRLRLNRIYPERGGMRLEWQGGIQAAQWLESSGDLESDDWDTLFAVPPPTPTNNAVIVFDSRPIRLYRVRAARE